MPGTGARLAVTRLEADMNVDRERTAAGDGSASRLGMLGTSPGPIVTQQVGSGVEGPATDLGGIDQEAEAVVQGRQRGRGSDADEPDGRPSPHRVIYRQGILVGSPLVHH